jgi:parallel beta-helix repeat protein
MFHRCLLPAACLCAFGLTGCGSSDASPAQGGPADASVTESGPKNFGPLPAGCGNGVLDEGEVCDYLLDCPQSCPPTDACQVGTLQGSPEHCTSKCDWQTVTACIAGDGCCPDGCDASNDADCPKYYVNADTGDDGNSGTSADQAWKTVSKVNAAQLAPGDSVGFKRGQVWREPLVVSASGAPGSPITYTSYGSGPKAALRMSEVIDGWQPSSAKAGCSSLWEAKVSFPMRQLFVDGKFVAVAHDPNTGYYAINNPQPSNTLVVTGTFPASGGDIAGANVCLRTVQWDLEERQATAYDPVVGAIALASPTIFPIQSGWGCYLENKLWMADQPTEWVYDSAASTVYYCAAAGDDPSKHRMEGSRNVPCLEGSIYTAECGIKAISKTNFVISDLAVEQAGGLGAWVHKSDAFALQRLDVRGTGGGGVADVNRVLGRAIVISDSPSTTTPANKVELCLVEDNVRDGISIFDSANVLAARNVIRRTGVVGMPRKSVAGIYVSTSDGARVEENLIDHSGYVGIIYSGLNVTLLHNFINYSCLVLDDCGATYTSGEHNKDTPFAGSAVRENIMLNSVGNSDGTPEPSTSNGIYFDFSSRGHEITGNTVSRTAAGVTFGDASECTVTGNTLYDNERQLQFLEYAYDQATYAGYSHGHTVTNNHLFSRVEQQFNLMLSSSFDTPSPGVFSGNSYDNPYDGSRLYRFRWIQGAEKDHQLGVGEWRRLAQGDPSATSADGFYEVSAGTASSPGSELVPTGTFDSDLGGFWAWPKTVSQAWAASCPGMEGGCLQATTSLDDGSEGLAITPQIPDLQAGNTYVLAFSVSATEESMLRVYAYGGDDGMRWNGTRITVGPARRDVRMFVNLTSSGKTTFQFVGIATPGVTLSLDNVSVRAAGSVTPNDRSDDTRLLWNASMSARQVDFGAEVLCDVATGDPVGATVTLAPFGSRILLACGCNRDGACNNKEAAASCPDDCTTP